MISLDPWDTDRFQFLDLRKECISPLVHPHPKTNRERMAFGAFGGKTVTCGGGDTPGTECYVYEAAAGWSLAGNLPVAVRAMGAVLIDEGLSTQRLYFMGGYNPGTGAYFNRAFYYDGNSIQ